MSRAGNLTKRVATALCVGITRKWVGLVRAVVMGNGREGMPRDLLSDHVGFVVCLGLEAAVVGPEVDGNADASDTALVDLHMSARSDKVCSRPIVLTISAASGPAIANSMSAYLFQKP